MTTQLQRIEAEALKLSVDERERLVEVLIDSLDLQNTDVSPDGAAREFGGFATAELQRYWRDESERRLQQLQSGEVKARPADEVMAEVRERLRASREVR